MRFEKRTAALWTARAVVLTFLLCGAAWAAPPHSTQPQGAPPDEGYAVWTPKELRFVYQGFTSRYSCDGLRDKVKSVLLKLGARKDLQVTPTPCSESLGTPTTFPGVTIKMHVLESANGKEYDATSPPVLAHWKLVDLTHYRDPVDAAGDCELIEQIKTRILPLFTTRNVEYSSTCIPNQLTVGGTRLKAEVLVASEQSAPPAPPGASGNR